MHIFSEVQNYAIQARLNFILGAKNYDTYFLGIQCSAMSEGLAVIHARSDFAAQTIAERYTAAVAVAIESVIHEPVRKVSVLTREKKVP